MREIEQINQLRASCSESGMSRDDVEKIMDSAASLMKALDDMDDSFTRIQSMIVAMYRSPRGTEH